MTKESFEIVVLVLGPLNLDSYIMEANMGVGLPRKVSVFKERWLMNLKRKYVLLIGMVSSCQYHGEMEGEETIRKITDGNEKTSLNAVWLCRMEVPPNGALDLNGSLHLIIGYLLKGDHEGLRV